MAKSAKFHPEGFIGLSHGYLRDDPWGVGRGIVSKIHKDYGGRLDIFGHQGKGEHCTGSSTLGVFAVDERARAGGAKVMLPEEAQLLIEHGIITKGTYEDLGVVLDFSGNNHDLALRLYDRLNKEDQELDRFPAILTGLVTVLHDNSTYGLALQPSESYPYQMRTAKILSEKGGNFEDNDTNLISEGLPSRLGKGQRTLYTRTQNKPSVDNLGLSGFYLHGGLGLLADHYDLANSDSGGRVILVGSESSKDYAALYAKLRKDYFSGLEQLRTDIDREISLKR
jgi:hypothetical protein